MEETIILFTLGPLTVTPYGALMALAALCGMALSWALSRQKPVRQALPAAMLAAGAGAVLGGHLLFCLVMLPHILSDFQQGLALLYRLNMGGYTLYGGLLGGMLGVWLAGRRTHQTAALLDALTPGALLVLVIGRAAEYFTDQGRGDYLDEIENAALTRFPLAVPSVYDDYVEWRYAVFVWEAAAALLILLWVLARRGRMRRESQMTETALTLVSASQILLEQLRQDGFLRFGFIRVTQLAAIGTICVVIGLRTAREVRAGGWTLWQALRLVLLGLGAAVVILVEFAYDKPQALPGLRICLGVMGVGCAVALLDAVKRGCRPRGALIVLAVVALGACAALCVLLHLNLEAEATILTTAMACALVVIAAATLREENASMEEKIA